MKKNKYMTRFLVPAVLFALLASCGDKSTSQQQESDAQAAKTAQTTSAETATTTQTSSNKNVTYGKPMELTGKVVFKPIEGGFYAIDGDDGKKYLPLNLPEHARKGGIKVAMQVLVKDNVVSIYNYGIPIEIISLDITDATADDGNVM